MTQTGRVVWHDCMTTDVDKAIEFYGAVFGWTTEVEADMCKHHFPR